MALNDDPVPMEGLQELIADNEAVLTRYYKLTAYLLFALMLAHVVFSGWFLYVSAVKSIPEVLQFVTFNVSVLVVEVFLSRIAFMLGSRSGQLRDLRYALLIASRTDNLDNVERVARTVMLLRRDASSLKVLDVEAFGNLLAKK